MEAKSYKVEGKPRRLTPLKADNLRALGKNVEGPLEDKSYAGPTSDKTVADLRDEAKARGIAGYSSMTRAQLVEALDA